MDPRITEKAAYMAEKGVYVFNVSLDATRREVADAVQAVFKVTPRSVRLTAVPKKSVQTRGTNRWGSTRGGKKAYVYLKKGDTLEIA
ncbi:MAG TPA: 50S ribosomal protein L23 [Candidatus Paceibacterota bacterium]|nr:50S ribosomal protein L23 [Candidatus Paceibacterota bacterium]